MHSVSEPPFLTPASPTKKPNRCNGYPKPCSFSSTSTTRPVAAKFDRWAQIGSHSPPSTISDQSNSDTLKINKTRHGPSSVTPIPTSDRLRCRRSASRAARYASHHRRRRLRIAGIAFRRVGTTRDGPETTAGLRSLEDRAVRRTRGQRIDPGANADGEAHPRRRKPCRRPCSHPRRNHPGCDLMDQPI